jgi:hypothetical protein
MPSMTFRLSTLSLAAAAAVLTAQTARAEVFVDVGAHSTRIDADIANAPEIVETTSSGLHVGVGARRELKRGSIGVRLEVDDLDSDLLLGVRTVDYRRHLSERIALAGFLGVARLDLATPAYGYYLGGGFELKDLFRGWDLGVDLRLGDKLARDNVLPTDPQGGRPDNFYDLKGLSLYLRYRF